MIHTPSHKNFTGFNNSRPRDRFPRNKGVMKRDVGYQMDDDRPRRKRRRFDQSDEKEQPMLRNNQNVSNSVNNDCIKFEFYYLIIMNYYFYLSHRVYLIEEKIMIHRWNLLRLAMMKKCLM